MRGGLMVDYAKLADRAKVVQEADKQAIERHTKLRTDPCSFFEKVKKHVLEEMKMANVELRKIGADTIDENHLPGFSDEMFITYGLHSLCRVGLGIMKGGCRVTAVISGPPNGYEISRKEYQCNRDASCSEVVSLGLDGLPVEGSHPVEIAVNIVSGILAGKFD
jgi:hypothetical protein